MRTEMQVGLGEAIDRKILLNKRISASVATQDERDEYKLLSEAINEIKLNLGFDCNGDGVPDTIEIFHATAKTSCCRFVPKGEKKKTVKKKSTSRSSTRKTKKKSA